MALITIQPFNIDSTKAYSFTGVTLVGANAPFIMNADPGTSGFALMSTGPGNTPVWSASASGYSGKSGYSGIGTSGYSGIQGVQGTSGYSGISGFSGTLPGVSGYSGAVGTSGFSGYSGAAGSGSTVINIDFGNLPMYSKTVSFAAAGATTSSNISMRASPSTASTSLGGDELEMDNFTCSAYCLVNGTIIAYITAVPGPVRGKRNFLYTIG
jgi:hypothetical protein